MMHTEPMTGQNNNEIWKPVLDNYYEVSNLGRVRRIVPGSRSTYVGKILKLSPDKFGYPIFNPYWSGKHKTFKVHQFIADTFLGPRPPGYQVNHKNGIKTDNRVENLEYVTPRDNTIHAIRTGLKRIVQGEGFCGSKMTAQEVWAIRGLYLQGVGSVKLSKQFNISKGQVWNIVTGRVWTHLPLMVLN